VERITKTVGYGSILESSLDLVGVHPHGWVLFRPHLDVTKVGAVIPGAFRFEMFFEFHLVVSCKFLFLMASGNVLAPGSRRQGSGHGRSLLEAAGDVTVVKGSPFRSTLTRPKPGFLRIDQNLTGKPPDVHDPVLAVTDGERPTE
jgi:hypothetical protein